MKCPFCGREFDETRAAPSCASCPSGGSCGNIRCPYCGHESPREPRLIARLRNVFSAGRKKR